MSTATKNGTTTLKLRGSFDLIKDPAARLAAMQEERPQRPAPPTIDAHIEADCVAVRGEGALALHKRLGLCLTQEADGSLRVLFPARTRKAVEAALQSIRRGGFRVRVLERVG